MEKLDYLTHWRRPKERLSIIYTSKPYFWSMICYCEKQIKRIAPGDDLFMCKILSLTFQWNLRFIRAALEASHLDDRWNGLFCIWKNSWFPLVIPGSDRPISGRALQNQDIFLHEWLAEDLDPSLSLVLSNRNAVSAKRRVVLKGALGCCDKREKCGWMRREQIFHTDYATMCPHCHCSARFTLLIHSYTFDMMTSWIA